MLLSCNSFRAECGLVADLINGSDNLLVSGPVNLTQKLHTMLTGVMQIWNYHEEVRINGFSRIRLLYKSSVTALFKSIHQGGDIQ
jgi:hypothetical protein